mmetsp:Transcript_38683/g.82568  ORF Transcript_38683/g.82568 Transcript_38683/m.82568 type:complete len:374 (-) Transcript_38683:513-1634(-)
MHLEQPGIILQFTSDFVPDKCLHFGIPSRTPGDTPKPRPALRRLRRSGRRRRCRDRRHWRLHRRRRWRARGRLGGSRRRAGGGGPVALGREEGRIDDAPALVRRVAAVLDPEGNGAVLPGPEAGRDVVARTLYAGDVPPAERGAAARVLADARVRNFSDGAAAQEVGGVAGGRLRARAGSDAGARDVADGASVLGYGKTRARSVARGEDGSGGARIVRHRVAGEISVAGVPNGRDAAALDGGVSARPVPVARVRNDSDRPGIIILTNVARLLPEAAVVYSRGVGVAASLVSVAPPNDRGDVGAVAGVFSVARDVVPANLTREAIAGLCARAALSPPRGGTGPSAGGRAISARDGDAPTRRNETPGIVDFSVRA